jgi:hypothetical protein
VVSPPADFIDISKDAAEPAFFQFNSYPRLRGVLPESQPANRFQILAKTFCSTTCAKLNLSS